MEKKYPSTFRDRGDFASGVYLRSELETYSDQTLELYFKDISNALKEGRNLTAERYTFLFKQIGYNSIDDMERVRKAKGVFVALSHYYAMTGEYSAGLKVYEKLFNHAKQKGAEFVTMEEALKQMPP